MKLAWSEVHQLVKSLLHLAERVRNQCFPLFCIGNIPLGSHHFAHLFKIAAFLNRAPRHRDSTTPSTAGSLQDHQQPTAGGPAANRCCKGRSARYRCQSQLSPSQPEQYPPTLISNRTTNRPSTTLPGRTPCHCHCRAMGTPVCSYLSAYAATWETQRFHNHFPRHRPAKGNPTLELLAFESAPRQESDAMRLHNAVTSGDPRGARQFNSRCQTRPSGGNYHAADASKSACQAAWHRLSWSLSCE